MNVAFDPWIPVVDVKGARTLVSLNTVLNEGDQYADLAVRPHERVSLMRLLLCVAHASLNGPKNYDEWCDVPKRLPEAATKYLENWKDSFELFHHEKPWLQIAKLEGTGDKSPIALLDFELATGNNATWGDHSGRLSLRYLPLERVALALLTFQNFSSGGGAPIAQWGNVKTKQVGNPDAPCLSQSMAHCLFRGKNLSETLHLNLPTYDTVLRAYKSITEKKKEINYEEVGIGKPVWEDFPTSPNSTSQSVVNATRTYLGRLVPISRWIRLIENEDRMYCCSGFKYDTYKDGFPAEPTASVRLVTVRDNNNRGGERTERRVVKVDPAKAMWRELSALLIKRTADGLGGPIAMENAPDESEFDFHVCALTRDQASMDIALESVFHITPAFRTNMLVYQNAVEEAEKVSVKLRTAIEQYRISIDGDWLSRVKRTEAKQQNNLKNKLAQNAFTSYWTTVEKNLPLLFKHIEAFGTDESKSSLSAWRKMLVRSAHDAYHIACGQYTPRQIRAFAKGYQKLISVTENQIPTTP